MTPEPTTTSAPSPAPESTSTPTTEPTPTEEPSAEPDTPPVLERGDQGDAVRRVQQQLHDLGYWTGPIDGVFGRLTEQAVLAFQGWEEITRDGIVGPETRAAVADAERPHPDHDRDDLLYIDEYRGVMLVIRDGQTRWAFHVSAGSYEHYQHELYGQRLADTPNGTWEISRQIDGVTESPLGVLTRPKYFHEDGIAVHGSSNVPPWGVSHGCVRVTEAAIDLIWTNDLAPIGTTVVVVGPEP